VIVYSHFSICRDVLDRTYALIYDASHKQYIACHHPIPASKRALSSISDMVFAHGYSNSPQDDANGHNHKRQTNYAIHMSNKTPSKEVPSFVAACVMLARNKNLIIIN